MTGESTNKSFLYSHQAKYEEIPFLSSGFLTLGVEVELQIIDYKSLDLSPCADQVITAFSDPEKLTQEIFQSMVEIRTAKCGSVSEVEKDLTYSFDRLQAVGNALGVTFSGTGCHPIAKYTDRIVTDLDRYKDLIDRNQWIARRLSICGLHIHIGMKSGDDCIKHINFLTKFLPHFLALSASSAFWQGMDTGLSTCRPTMFESMPTAGHPYILKDWQHFEQLVGTLKASHAIKDIKDLWWDIRPSPKFGTLEIRVCDGTASLSETLAIVAFAQLLCRMMDDIVNLTKERPEWIYRENKWRAMRHGLEADIVLDESGRNRPIRDDITYWLGILEPYADAHGCGKYLSVLEEMVKRGNSSQRQKTVFEETDSLNDVIKHNIREFQKRKPIYNS